VNLKVMVGLYVRFCTLPVVWHWQRELTVKESTVTSHWEAGLDVGRHR